MPLLSKMGFMGDDETLEEKIWDTCVTVETGKGSYLLIKKLDKRVSLRLMKRESLDA